MERQNDSKFVRIMPTSWPGSAERWRLDKNIKTKAAKLLTDDHYQSSINKRAPGCFGMDCLGTAKRKMSIRWTLATEDNLREKNCLIAALL